MRFSGQDAYWCLPEAAQAEPLGWFRSFPANKGCSRIELTYIKNHVSSAVASCYRSISNWESAPVHSVALTAEGEGLSNVAQATLEIFSATTPPVCLTVSVGLDPVSSECDQAVAKRGGELCVDLSR